MVVVLSVALCFMALYRDNSVLHRLRCPDVVPRGYAMPKQTLNDRGLKALKPAAPGKRRVVQDAVVPGLAIKVTDRGHKSFVLIKRYPGSRNPAPHSLGEYGAISLEQARNKARDWLALLRKGIDPAVEEERQRQAEVRRQENSFAA